MGLSLIVRSNNDQIWGVLYQKSCIWGLRNNTKFIGKSRTAITNLLRILNLEGEVKNMLQNQLIELGHAKALLALSSELQIKMAHTVINKKLSVRQTEEAIQKIKTPTTSIPNKNDSFPLLDMWSKCLSDEVCKPVDIHVRKDGKGRVVINFDTIDELTLLVNNLKLQKHSA